MTPTTECDVTYPPEILPYPNEGEIGEVIVMTDWAEVLFKENSYVNESGDEYLAEGVAIELLRKAKADGWKEAADYLNNFPDAKLSRNEIECRERLAVGLIEIASKLSRS